MASMFRRDPRSKITPLFREVFGEIASQSPDDPIYVAIAATAKLCNMRDFDAEAIANRLLDYAEKAKAASGGKKSRPGKGGGYGASYTKWLAELSTEQLCLMLADYDFNKAKSLYSDTDIDDLSIMVDLKTGHEWQLLRTRFEACVLGFGGKLEGQSDGPVHEVDMNDNKSVEEMIAAMKRLGL